MNKSRLYLPQPERAYLHLQMKKAAPYVVGDVIDVGGFNNRYKALMTVKSWKNANLLGVSGSDLVLDLNKVHDMESQFDTVICNQVIGDVFNPFHAVEELLRLLKPGGHLVLTESLFNESHDEPYDFFRFTEHGARQLVMSSKIKSEIVLIDRRGKFFSTMIQGLNRVIIDRFNPQALPKLLAKILQIILRATTRLALTLDKHCKHTAYEKFYLGWMLIAKRN